MNLDLFRGVVPFVAVAEASSFRGAAVTLGVSPAAVSKAVQALEAQLGVALFDRDSRRVVLTRAGAAFLERCRPAVSAMQGAREAVDDLRNDPKGTLVLSVPVVLAPLVMPVVATLTSRYPALGVTVKVSDAVARLADEGVDVALRIGALDDSSLVTRRLFQPRLVTVASPAYLSAAGVPKTLEALDAHRCLALLGPGGRPHPWWFSSGPRAVKHAVLFDHGPSLVDAALASLGLAQAFDFMTRDHLEAGRLVQVLAALAAQGPDVHVVTTAARRRNPAVRAVFDVLAEGLLRR